MKAEFLIIIKSTLISLFAFLAPVHALMFAIGVLITIDFFLGNYCAYKQKIPIRSKEWKKTIVKMVLYQVAVLTAFLLDLYFLPGNVIVRIAAMAIGLTEARSIYEHIYILTGLNIWLILKDKLKDAASATSKDTIKTQIDAELPGSDKKDPPSNAQ